MKNLALGLGVLGLSFGCVRAAGSVAQPTAIERQLLGAYQELDDALILESSARSGLALPVGAELRQQALRMRLLQRFNEDDVQELKKLGCVGEGLDARLVPVPCPRGSDPAWVRVRERVLREENEARDVILRWAARQLATRRNVDSIEGLLPEVRAAYRATLEEAARPDDLFEDQTGSFVPRSTL